MCFRCICFTFHRLIMDRSRKWTDLRSKMTWQTSHQVQPSLLHLHRHYSNDQCQLRRQWNAGQPEMNLIAVSARLLVIASFWKNKINFNKMAPEMQRQCPQHLIRISIISPIFHQLLFRDPKNDHFHDASHTEARSPSRRWRHGSRVATNFDYPCLAGLLIQQIDIVWFFNPWENLLHTADFVTSLHATFGPQLAKLRGFVEDAFLSESTNEKHQMA